MKKIGYALFAAGLLAAASSASANERENVSLRVDTSNVNFADAESVAQFRREVERQIAQVCNPGDRLEADVTPDFRCRAEMRANLEPTVYRLAMRATERAFAGTQD